MEKTEIARVILVINGHYSQKSEEYSKQEFMKVKKKLSSPSYVNNAFYNKASEKGYEILKENLVTICPNCANMLKCPKVRDSLKKGLKAYPYITYGAEMVFIDKQAREEYDQALEEYRSRIDAGDETVIGDQNLLRRLNHTGIDVPSICVYECNKFISDKDKEKENLKKAASKFVDDRDELDKLMAKMKTKGSIKIPDIIKYFEK